MKKLILIALAFVSLQVVAQDKVKVQRASKVEHKAERKAKAKDMKNMSAEDQATIATKRLTLALDLDDKQQSQIKELILNETTQRKQRRAEKAEEKKVAEVSKVESMNKKLDQKIAVKKKMKAILTAEQYKKWEGMQGRRHSKGKEKSKMKAKY